MEVDAEYTDEIAAVAWACNGCTFKNVPSVDQCEVCGGPRPGKWTCKSCTLQNCMDAEACVACRAPRATRRHTKKGVAWRPANDLLASRPLPRAAPAHQVPVKRWQPARSRGQFVQGACRLVFGHDGEGWRHTWRVDMPCSEIASCPICLEEPSMPRISECGHIFCLPCVLRHLQTATTCPICGVSPMMGEELRPVQLEVVKAPQVGDEWFFQLVRRAGQNIGLPWQQPASGLTQEGVDGWRFARRVRGNPVSRLDLLHREILALEGAREDPDAGLDRAVATHLITKLQEQLVEVTAAAAAFESLGAAATVQPATAAGKIEDVPTVVFYQSADTQLIFLEPLLTKHLLATYGSWASLPERITLRPLKALRDVSVTEDLQWRHRFLGHLTVGGEVIFVDGTVEVPGADQRADCGKASLQQHQKQRQRQALPQQHRRRGGRGGRGISSQQQTGHPIKQASDVPEPAMHQSVSPCDGVQGVRQDSDVVAVPADSPPVGDGWDD